MLRFCGVLADKIFKAFLSKNNGAIISVIVIILVFMLVLVF